VAAITSPYQTSIVFLPSTLPIFITAFNRKCEKEPMQIDTIAVYITPSNERSTAFSELSERRFHIARLKPTTYIIKDEKHLNAERTPSSMEYKAITIFNARYTKIF
jgi:hypothetical protein